MTCSQLNKLQELCDLIAKKGTVIVAAFDNYGAMSYPASFHNVIGVDTSGISLKKREWAYVDNSPINVLTHKGIVRCQSLEGRRIITEGSSFTSAYISAFLLRKILSGEVLNLSSAIQVLRDNAKLIFDFGTVTPIAKMPIPQKALTGSFERIAETTDSHTGISASISSSLQSASKSSSLCSFVELLLSLL